jgi:hypothetical protein
MKIKFNLLFILLMSTPSFASFINGENYISNKKDNFWVNNDLSLDILRLSWAATLGEKIEQQKTLGEVESYVANNQEGWRWATVSEFTAIVNWFDTDTNNTGWSDDQNIGTNLFVEINGFGSKYYGEGAGGEVYQNGYDHEGYTYWQFGTLLDGIFNDTWLADFGEQYDTVSCPVWSIHCNSFGNQGYLDLNSPWGWTTYAMGLKDYNVAPLLVRAINVAEPTGVLLAFIGIIGLVKTRRRLK